MGRNIFSGFTPSENGLSDFERGLSQGPFQVPPTSGKTAAPGRNPKQKVYPSPIPANTDPYPGHDGYLFYVNRLLENLRNDKIYLPTNAVTTRVTQPAGGNVTPAKLSNTKTMSMKKHLDETENFYVLTIDDLSNNLVDRFFRDFQSSRSESNSAWCDPGGTLRESDLVDLIQNALRFPQGFPSNRTSGMVNPLDFRDDSWHTWAGYHWGYWLTDYGDLYLDTAKWDSPVPRETDDPLDQPDTTTGRPRMYDHQHVEWLERRHYKVIAEADGKERVNYAHHGWNSSHPDVSYLWGWDPKDWEYFPKYDPATKKWLNVDPTIKYPGTWGVHVGFPFLAEDADDIRFIVWLTPSEVFLETVNFSRMREIKLKPEGTAQDKEAQKKGKIWMPRTILRGQETPKEGNPKSSTALNGHGQWVIER